ncbi:MAG: NTP transferase domain-containing protein [Promethearchaeota archaeon]
MQAIILASGRGARFRPLTDTLPKPLLPLLNRPLLEHLLTNLTKVGCTDFYVTVGYAHTQLEQFLTALQDSSSIESVYIPDWEQGPLTSFRTALLYINSNEPFLLVPADLYISPQNLKLLTSSDLPMTILYDPQTPLPGTQLQIDSSHQVSKIVQSLTFRSNHYSTIPALRGTPEFRTFSIKNHLETQSTVFTLLRQWLRLGHPLQGVPIHDSRWCDVDSPHQLLDLNQHLLTRAWPPDPVPPGTYVPSDSSLEGPLHDTTLTLGEHSKILGPTLLGPNVEVGDHCLIRGGTTLGSATRIQANSELAHCITLPHTHVPSNVDLSRSLLDAHGNILHADE